MATYVSSTNDSYVPAYVPASNASYWNNASLLKGIAINDANRREVVVVPTTTPVAELEVEFQYRTGRLTAASVFVVVISILQMMVAGYIVYSYGYFLISSIGVNYKYWIQALNLLWYGALLFTSSTCYTYMYQAAIGPIKIRYYEQQGGVRTIRELVDSVFNFDPRNFAIWIGYTMVRGVVHTANGIGKVSALMLISFFVYNLVLTLPADQYPVIIDYTSNVPVYGNGYETVQATMNPSWLAGWLNSMSGTLGLAPPISTTSVPPVVSVDPYAEYNAYIAAYARA
jgi:hypothetical protein